MNLVRSLNKYYGGIVDRITVMAKSAYVGSQTQNLSEPRSGFYYQFSEIGFYLRIYALQFTNWVIRGLYGKYVDDFIEDQTIKHSE